MRNNLDLLLSDGILDEVLGRLKSGKEADVFQVLYRGQVVAAKVYKDRQQRSFQNNAAYTEGRKVRNSRTQRAIDKGSRYGRDEAEQAWKSSEANALQRLYTFGVRVPTPVMFYEGVLLMQLVTDAEGDIAPRLIDAPIRADQAGALYRDLRTQIIGMLCCDLIHGDLSPYNVLLGAAGPTIIDFPQTISAAHNTQSEMFFRRDFENILNFLAGFDRSLFAHRGDARAIWQAYVRRDLTADFVPPAAAPRPPPQAQPMGGHRERREPQQGWSPREEGSGHREQPRGPRDGAQGQPRSDGRGFQGQPRGPQGGAHGSQGQPRGPQGGAHGPPRQPRNDAHGFQGQPRGPQSSAQGSQGQPPSREARPSPAAQQSRPSPAAQQSRPAPAAQQSRPSPAVQPTVQQVRSGPRSQPQQAARSVEVYVKRASTRPPSPQGDEPAAPPQRSDAPPRDHGGEHRRPRRRFE